jgi:hypothetical protein
MDYSEVEIKDFGARLASLGGRLAFEQYPANRYIDIEEFFLDATRFVFVDERLARCIEHWVRTYGFLIGPSKLRKLIEKENYPYDPAVLGVFLKLIATNEKQINLKPLEKLCKKKASLIYRSDSKIRVKSNDLDPIWLKFNIATHHFVDETKKYLLSYDYTLEHAPELRYRIETGDILSSDYKAFLVREGLGKSLNSICKRIHAYYSNLHKYYTRFEKFGIHARLVQES